MDKTIITTLITITGGLTTAGITFFFTKRYELIREWREKKLGHYKELLSSLSDLAVDGQDKKEANKRFALAYNTIALVAPQTVIDALSNYQQGVNRGISRQEHDLLLAKLLIEIRKDIKLSSKDDEGSFKFNLIGRSK